MSTRDEAITSRRAEPARLRASFPVVGLLVALSFSSFASAEVKGTALRWLEEHEAALQATATRLWEEAEPAHHEIHTARHLTEELAKAGFTIELGVADLPTAFVASFGRGEPVIGIVALLDALPGLSQQRGVSARAPLESRDAGQACGHHLIMAADLLAVLALAAAVEKHQVPGTIRLYGAPAEEIYHGGVYMARAGAFNDADALLFWHPSSVTTVIARSGLAMDSVRYLFEGLASDATDAADKGRNALDPARAFLDAIDDARASLPETAVVSTVLLDGGRVPSVVPERSRLWLFAHERDRPAVERLRVRIDALAEEAARASATHLTVQHLSATSGWLINRRLAEALQTRLEVATSVPYRTKERSFAESLRRDFGDAGRGDTFFSGSLPLEFEGPPVPISDDTAEASWIAPRGGFLVAAYPAGIPSHTWQWTAAGLSDFALEGTMRAARVLVDLSADLLVDAELLAAAKREHEDATRGQAYRSPLLPEREPFDFLARP